MCAVSDADKTHMYKNVLFKEDDVSDSLFLSV